MLHVGCKPSPRVVRKPVVNVHGFARTLSYTDCYYVLPTARRVLLPMNPKNIINFAPIFLINLLCWFNFDAAIFMNYFDLLARIPNALTIISGFFFIAVCRIKFSTLFSPDSKSIPATSAGVFLIAVLKKL
jgi:hypothetical protein